MIHRLRPTTGLVAVLLLWLPRASLSAKEPAEYRFSDGFSDRQGVNNWYYKEWDGSAYADLKWDGEVGRWQGSCKFCPVSRGAAHPDTTDAVIAWKAPRAGDVTILGVIERLSPKGDGTRARILLSEKQIWPSTPWQEVYPSFMVQHVVVAHVEEGEWIYFHLNRWGNADNDTTLWDPTIRYDSPPRFILDAAQRVMDKADLQRVGIDYMDAPLCADFQGKGRPWVWMHSQGGDRSQKFLGPLDAPAQKLVFKKTDKQFFTGNPGSADGKWWLTNFYRHTDGSLLGFIHVESSGTSHKKFRLGLAYSTNDGDSWVYLGHVIGQQGDPDDLNITGTPYIIKDGYFYVYYRDAAGACVACAAVAEVMEAAKKHRVTRWHKYFDGGFTEPGLGGRASALGVETDVLHSTAAYSTTKKKYILTGYNHGPGRGVWIAFSDDGVKWTKGGWIQHGRADNPTLSPYVTVVAPDGEKNATVGDSFYVYWAFAPDFDKTDGKGLQNVIRQKVTLIAP
jgi:hypothetical protein